MSTLGEFSFNPLQRRGPDGKWITGGAVDRLTNDATHPHHADHLARARRIQADESYRPGGGSINPRGATLNGYGKAFDGKTEAQIANEFDRGKHRYEDLPDPVKDRIAEHAKTIRSKKLSPITLAEHHAAGRRARAGRD